MDWAREHFDRLAVFAGAAFLVLCAFFIWRSAADFSETYATVPSPGPAKAAGPTAKALEVEAAMKMLAEPPQWTFTGRSGLFVPEPHFIGQNGQPATLQTTEVHPPVPNEWLNQFSLPIADADVLEQDGDGDGFTNLEEWQGHSNPTDKNSHPPYLAKLKVKSVATEPFRYVFASRSGDTFTINSSDRSEPTQFVRVGQTIPGSRYQVVNYEEKAQPNPATGGEVDVSELTIENTETHEHLTLVKEKVMLSPQSIVTFVYSWGQKREFPVKKEEEFSLPPQADIKYKLVDVQPTKAVLVNPQKPEERIEIGPLQP